MARATRPDGIVDRDDLPEDGSLQVFTVSGPTIRDSTGAYCTNGQEAALNKRDAKKYHKAQLIQVALPDFGGDDESDQSEQPKRRQRPAPKADAGADKDQIKP